MSIVNGATRAQVVVPSDVTVVGAKALYVGTSGNITIEVKQGDTPVLFSSVPVGVFPVAAYRVLATGTAASNMVALT